MLRGQRVRKSLTMLGLLAFFGTTRVSGGTPSPSEAPAPAPHHGASPLPTKSRQLLLVRSAGWAAVSGTLGRYERTDATHWVLVGSETPLNVGRSGMAWGRGLAHPTEPGPVKREGDGRSPAGAFLLGTAFGAADALPEGAKAFPYLHALGSSYCVEDPRSKFYNQVVDAPGLTAGARPYWSELKRADGVFRWGIVVRQNDVDTQPGAGSCVFLHLWRGAGKGTAGCTAMPPEHLESTLRWLDPAAEPVLVQLPEPVYRELREAWNLP